MAPVVLTVLLVLAMAGHSSATWCICKDGDVKTLQKTLDYACGAGADCGPTHQNQPCFNPNTVRDHCNYAVNSYYQKYRQTAPATSCDFSGAATVVNSDPSTAGCSYPASASAAATPSTNGTNGGLTGPSNGAFGGTNNGLGPSGIADDSHGGTQLLPSVIFLSSIILTISAHLLL